MQQQTSASPRLGTALIVASTFAYSTAGYFTRLINLDVPEMLFWRGLFGGVFMLVVIGLLEGRNVRPAFRAIGWPGLLVATLSAVATLCFINALRLTTVADVMAIEATSPFVAGALAWLVIGERESWRIVAASLVAMIGVGIIVTPGLSGGSWAGAALAFAMTLALSAMFVVMRLERATSMLPASCLSTFLAASMVWPFCRSGVPATPDLIKLGLFGTTQFGLGLILLTLGARHATALRLSLLSRLETVLGPLWVLLAFGEVPATTTVIGGTIVLAAAVAATLVAQPAEQTP